MDKMSAMTIDQCIRQNRWGDVYNMLLDKDSSVEDQSFVAQKLGEMKCMDSIQLFLSTPGFDTLENRVYVAIGGAQSGHIQVVKDMMSSPMMKTKESERTDTTTSSSLHRIGHTAGLYGRMDIIDYLITKHPDKTDMTVIAIGAARGGYLHIVERLVKTGGIDESSYNVIAHSAAMGGHDDIVGYMIDEGADDLSYIAEGAAEGGFVPIVDDMVTNADYVDYNAIAAASMRGGYTNIVEFMIDQGADANA